MVESDKRDGVEGRHLSRTAVGRLVGAVIGAAVGDAAGAPYEFGGPGQWSGRFPQPAIGGRGELVGGGAFNWAPGEATDDTQMAVALAESLIASGGFDPDDVWNRFRAWFAGATDVGVNTSAVLAHAERHDAARRVHEQHGRSASNGSVMRIAPVAVRGVVLGSVGTVELAIAQSALTHHDPAAGIGAALVAETARRCILSGDFEASLAAAFDAVREHGGPDAAELLGDFEVVLNPTFDPRVDLEFGNGSVWGAVCEAMWGVRHGTSFEDVIARVVDLGGDTDTVAAIAGTMAGAVFGRQAIPSRWTTYLHVSVDGPDGTTTTYRTQDLVNIARGLVGLPRVSQTPPERPKTPKLVHDAGVWASDLLGAAGAPVDHAIVSLCLTEDRFLGHPWRREIYLRDEEGDHNPSLGFAIAEAVDAIDAFLAEGRNVVVHCHGGRSRTGLVLKAWWMRHHGATHEEAHDWLRGEWEHYSQWTADFDVFLDDVWEPAVAGGKGGK